MKKILVGFDGSAPAVRAAKEAGALAKQLGMGVHLLLVVPPSWLLASPDLSGDIYVQFREAQETRGRALLDEARTPLEPLGIPVETTLLEGPPANLLVAQAESPDVAMIAVGATSGHALARMFLGSVAYRVLHLTNKPVLVVH